MFSNDFNLKIINYIILPKNFDLKIVLFGGPHLHGRRRYFIQKKNVLADRSSPTPELELNFLFL